MKLLCALVIGFFVLATLHMRRQAEINRLQTALASMAHVETIYGVSPETDRFIRQTKERLNQLN